MTETEPAAAELSALLKDLAGSLARSAQQEDRVQELIRLYDQPLLLRSFMARSGEPLPQRISLDCLSILVRREFKNPLERRKTWLTSYAALEPVSQTSLTPEVFTPPRMDREQVLGDLGSGTRHVSGTSRLVGLVLLCGSLALAALLAT